MLASELITEINYTLRGTDDEAPESGSDDYTYWLSVANRLIRNLYNDPSKQWKSTYKETPPNEVGTVATTGTTTLTGTSTRFTDYRAGDKLVVSGETVRTIATITSDTSLTVTVAFSNTASSKTFTRQTIIATGVQSYSLHRRFVAASDVCYVLDSDDHRFYFDIVQPKQRVTDLQQVFINDENPQVLTFANEIESTYGYVGGTLYIPGYYLPVAMTAATDDVPVDDPDWLVVATAAKIAFNDITYEDKYPDLNAEANALYTQMLKRNRKGTYNNPSKSAYSNYRIRDTRSRV